VAGDLASGRMVALNHEFPMKPLFTAGIRAQLRRIVLLFPDINK
jgi:hypothetical protein